MRPRSRIGRLGLATAAAVMFLGAAPEAPRPEPSAPPEPPPAVMPGVPPAPSAPSKGFIVKEGEVHDGAVWEFTPSVVIAGTQNGNLHVWTATMQVPGKIVGNVQAAASNVDISGEVQGNVTLAGGGAQVSGTIRGDLKVYGGTFLLAPQGHVTGDLEVFSSQMTVDGTVDGDLVAKGGQVALGGRVGEDASIECDTFLPGPQARIEGDLRYRARNEPDFRGGEAVGGTIVANDAGVRVRHSEERSSESHPVVWWVVRCVFDLLCGFLGLWAFRRWVPAVYGAVQGDTLRSLGIGFVTVLVVIAVNLSAILLVTIPIVLIFDLLFALLFLCLVKAPVALWAGRFVFAKIGRGAEGTYGPFAAGTLALCLLTAIPYLGKPLWFVASLLGLGAIVSGVQRGRLDKKLAKAASAAADGRAEPMGA